MMMYVHRIQSRAIIANFPFLDPRLRLGRG